MPISVFKNNVVPTVFQWIPFGLLQKLTGVSPLIPYYHVVSDDEVPHVKHLYHFKNVKQFTRDLETFLQLYNVIDLRDLVNSLRTGNPLPRNSLLLQFDDGFREVYDVVAPILLEKGVTATFFLIGSCLDNKGMAHSNKVSILLEHLTKACMEAHRKQLFDILADWGVSEMNLKNALLSLDYTKKDALDVIATLVDCDFTDYLLKYQPYLTSEQVHKLIGKGFSIGAHSMDHPKYSLIPFQEQLYQTRASITYICEKFSLDYGAFAFPNGDDNLSDEYFKDIFADGKLEASFGNVGKLRNIHPRHFPRLPMENESATTEKVIGRYYAKATYDLLVGRVISKPIM